MRDDQAGLRRLADCLLEQEPRFADWQIVDTGSTDGTLEVAEALVRENRNVHLTRLGHLPQRRRGAVVAEAFELGISLLSRTAPEIVFKIDADVTFGPGLCDSLLGAFAGNAELGVASGARYELARGSWRRHHLTGSSVEAQCRAYRRSCLDEVLPLECHKGWDGIDEARAALCGWATAVVEGVRFHHHRPIGGRERNLFSGWAQEGRGAYYMGYRPLYLMLKTAHHACRGLSAFGLLAGALAAWIEREPRCADPRVVEYIRAKQSLRRLPLRILEAHGLAGNGRDRVDLFIVADPGGHLIEAIGLRELWSRYSCIWVTAEEGDGGALPGERVVVAHGPTRRSMRNLLRNTGVAASLVWRFRPRVIVSTGAGLCVPFMWVGKLAGATTIYIECSGRVGLSLSGRLVRPATDRFYVQWPDVAARCRGTRYAGSILFGP